MKDEEIKLPPVPSLVTETDWHQAFINYGREAVRLNQHQSEPLPFNLEAAKRGDVVVYGNDYCRWIGISQHHKGMNVLEGANGLKYAADCDLFMKPRPMRTVWITQKSDGTISVSDNELKQMCDAFNSECDTYTSSVLIPDRR